jgi:hypothetical protein
MQEGSPQLLEVEAKGAFRTIGEELSNMADERDHCF